MREKSPFLDVRDEKTDGRNFLPDREKKTLAGIFTRGLMELRGWSRKHSEPPPNRRGFSF
jgi:hypothetical protein